MKFFKIVKKPDKEKDQEYKEYMSTQLEKHDRFAMVVSAFLVIVLPCLLILGGIALLAMLIFGVL